MKILYISCIAYIFISFWSCKEEVKTENKPNESVAAPGQVERIYTTCDTVRFIDDSSRMAVIGVMKGIIQSDSTFNVPVDVLYYVKGQQVSVFSDTFRASGNEELSHYFEATDSNGNSCERFFTVTYGYPACGYTQNHLTFSASENNCYFLAKHVSAADGAYGGGMEFFNACGAQSAVEISAAEVSREPAEADENIIVVSYADSVIYHFDGNTWKSQPVTEKGKIYRIVTETF